MNTQQAILDIAMNLTRMGNWAADGYALKQKRIATFLEQTSTYVANLETVPLNQPFHRTFNTFLKEFRTLQKDATNLPHNEKFWAERMMTWGNILTHRAKLLRPQQ